MGVYYVRYRVHTDLHIANKSVCFSKPNVVNWEAFVLALLPMFMQKPCAAATAYECLVCHGRIDKQSVTI